jgi:hypothetical protein
VILPSCESLRPPADDGPEQALDRLPDPLPDAAPGDGPAPPEARVRAQDALVLIREDPRAPRWEEALDQLLRVWRIYPSKKLAGWIAKCAIEVERTSLAIDAYERFLESGAHDNSLRHELDERIKPLLRNAVIVHLSKLQANSSLEDTIADASQRSTKARFTPTSRAVSLRVRPGHHVFQSSQTVAWEVDLSAGTEVRHAFIPVAQPCR